MTTPSGVVTEPRSAYGLCPGGDWTVNWYFHRPSARAIAPPISVPASLPVVIARFREIGLVWSADRLLAPAVRAFGDYAESAAVGA